MEGREGRDGDVPLWELLDGVVLGSWSLRWFVVKEKNVERAFSM